MFNELFGDIGQEAKAVSGDIGQELKTMRDELKPGPRTRTITVAKPACTPARSIITATFQKYGVKLYGLTEQTRVISAAAWARQQGIKADIPAEKTLPVATVATVTVSADAAAWAEYLLLRTGKLYCPYGYVNRKNEAWAAQHGGRMPPAWNSGAPWIEKDCKEGMTAWQPLRGMAVARNHGRE